MKKLSLAFVLAAGAAMQFAPLQTASAADLGGGGGYKDTPYVVMPWQGFYFGGHGGGAWGSANVHDHFDYHGDPDFVMKGDTTSAIYGGQVGYNLQQGHFVFGVEGDIGYLGLSAHTSGHANASSGGPDFPVGGQYSVSGGLYGDITGRVGYATNRVLFYGKGGVAFLNADVKADYTGENCNFTWHCGGNAHRNDPSRLSTGASDTLVGWTIGAGAELAITPSWSLKAEYQHFDFGSMSYSTNNLCTVVPGTESFSSGCPGTYYTSRVTNGKTDVSVTADAVKVGLNYRVGGH